MTDDDVAVTIRRASPDDSLDHLVHAAWTRAVVARGGSALLEQIFGPDVDLDRVRRTVDDEVAAGHVWVAQRGTEIIAGALVSGACLQAIWVQSSNRRRRVATALVTVLLSGDDAPRDAWALPGDRATKSLYESVGWKARLLTMRGA